MRFRSIEGRKLVEAVAIGFLDARLFRQVIDVIGWQLDTQSGKGIALVACLLPRRGSLVMHVGKLHLFLFCSGCARWLHGPLRAAGDAVTPPAFVAV
jgi:hypothetical protein